MIFFNFIGLPFTFLDHLNVILLVLISFGSFWLNGQVKNPIYSYFFFLIVTMTMALLVTALKMVFQ